MRNTNVVNSYKDGDYDVLIRRRFLWWPLKINEEWRWLEVAAYSEARLNIFKCEDWQDHMPILGEWRDDHL